MPTPAPCTPEATAPPMRLGLIDDLVREHPGLTAVALRSMISRAAENGLSEHLYRPAGKRGALYIDMAGFADWIRQHREAA